MASLVQGRSLGLPTASGSSSRVSLRRSTTGLLEAPGPTLRRAGSERVQGSPKRGRTRPSRREVAPYPIAGAAGTYCELPLAFPGEGSGSTTRNHPSRVTAGWSGSKRVLRRRADRVVLPGGGVGTSGKDLLLREPGALRDPDRSRVDQEGPTRKVGTASSGRRRSSRVPTTS